MAKISTYPIVSTPTLDDMVIGTDVEDLNNTRNFPISDILGLIGFDTYVPYIGATKDIDLGVYGILSSSYTVAGGTSSQFLKADGTLDSTAYTPQSRTLTINGVTNDLSVNRTWTLPTINTFTTIGTGGLATYSGGTLNIPEYQTQGNYITQLTGEVSATGPGVVSATLSNNAVISKVLTGLNILGGSIVATDSIVEAFGKVQNQINSLIGGSIYKGTWNANINDPTLTSGVGTLGWYYIVNVPGNTNLDGITDWKLGDWAIYDGTAWQKVDNTDAVISVNGYTGVVNLTYTDVGAVPTSRTLTINGISHDLTADRSWTVGNITGTAISGQVAYWNGTSTQTGSNNLFWDISNNRLGIGTASPSYTLDVNGTVNTYRLRLSGSDADIHFAEGASSDIYMDVIPGTRTIRTRNFNTTTPNVGATSIMTGNLVVSSDGTITETYFPHIGKSYINNGDFFGVNTNNPLYNLDVNGTLHTSGQNTLDNLAGVGTRMVVSSSVGLLSTQAIPVTSIATSGPITGGTITSSGTIGITQSGVSTDGYLSSTDWNTFNNKQNALTNPVTGTGSVYYIPMWTGAHSLGDSIISYSSSVVDYNYNSSSGATVNYINTNGVGYTYSIQMNNIGTRQTYHSYTDGNIIQRINSNDVSRNLQSGQLVLPYYTTTSSFTGTAVGYLAFNASGNIITAAIPSLTGYVPYTGATTNVDLGEYELKAGQLTLDITPTGTAAVGTTRWNDAIGSSETTLKGGNVVLKNGVDLVARVVNKVTPNQTLTKAQYQAVRVGGAQGQRLAVALAQADGDPNSADTLGVVTETIPTNQEGFIMAVGSLEGINTTGSLQGETWADGDVLYLSPTTPGGLTNVKPNGSTGHIVVIGYVEYAHINNGKIYVKIMNGWELDELHNVFINNPLNNQGLFYTSSTKLWENKSIVTALGYTPYNATNPSGFVNYNIYTNDGTLAGDRYVNANNNNLWIDNVDTLRVSIGGTLSNNEVALFESSEPNINIKALGASNSASLFLSPSTSAQYGDIHNRTGGGLRFYTGGTPSINMIVEATGQLKLNAYTSTSSFTGILAGYLGFDASGNILTVSAGSGTVTSIATSGPITGGTITTSGTIGITQSTTSTDGYLSSTDWNTFNSRVPSSRTLTINGVTHDLSADRSWTVSATGVNIYNSDGVLTADRTVGASASNWILTFEPRVWITTDNVADVSLGTQALYISNGATYAPAFSSAAADFTGIENNILQIFQGNSTFDANAVNSAIYNINIINPLVLNSTITMTQGTGVRAMASGVFQNQYGGEFNSTITHLAGIQVLGGKNSPTKTGTGALAVTNGYGLLINDINESGNFNITNRWGVYQEGALDRNYFAGEVLIRTSSSAGAALTIGPSTSSSASVNFVSSGSVLESAPDTGDMEVDQRGLLYYTHNNSNRGVVTSEQFVCLLVSFNLNNNTSLQRIFNATPNGALTVKGSTAYFFECYLIITSMSTTSGNMGFNVDGAGTATLTSAAWFAHGLDANSQTTAANITGIASTTVGQTGNILVANAGTTAHVFIKGVLRINTGGTIIPSLQLTNASAAVVGANSWFRIWAIGEDLVTSVGNWS